MTEERKADHHNNIKSQPVDDRPQPSKTDKPSFWTWTNIIGLGLGVLYGATSGAVVAFLSHLIIIRVAVVPPGESMFDAWNGLFFFFLIGIATSIGAIIGVYGGLFGAFIALWVVSKFVFNNVLKWLLIVFGACVGGTLAALVGLGVWLVYLYL